MVRIHLGVDALGAAFTQTFGTGTLPVAAAGLTLARLVAAPAVLIVVSLGIDTVAAAQLLLVRALAPAVAADLATLALVSAAAAVVYVALGVHALPAALFLLSGTLARAAAAKLAGCAARGAGAAELRVRGQIDAALPALDQSAFAIGRAAPLRTHFVGPASNAARAAMAGVGCGVDADSFALGTAAHALTAALDAACAGAAAGIAGTAVSSVGRRIGTAPGAELGSGRATTDAVTAAFAGFAADATSPAICDIAGKVAAPVRALDETATAAADAVGAGVAECTGSVAGAAVGWVRFEQHARAATQRFLRHTCVHGARPAAGCGRRAARPRQRACRRRAATSHATDARSGGIGANGCGGGSAAAVAARRRLRRTRWRHTEQSESEEHPGKRERIHEARLSTQKAASGISQVARRKRLAMNQPAGAECEVAQTSAHSADAEQSYRGGRALRLAGSGPKRRTVPLRGAVWTQPGILEPQLPRLIQRSWFGAGAIVVRPKVDR